MFDLIVYLSGVGIAIWCIRVAIKALKEVW
jgi:hypothetical protein